MGAIIGLSHRPRFFKNGLLRKIVRHKRDEVTVECRKLHKEEPTDLYASPNVLRVIKSRRMRWGERRGYTEFWSGNLRLRDHLEDPGVDRRIILRWIFRK